MAENLNRSDFVSELSQVRQVMVEALERVASTSNCLLQALQRLDMMELEAYRQGDPAGSQRNSGGNLCGVQFVNSIGQTVNNSTGVSKANRCQPVSPMVSGLVIQKPTVALQRLACPDPVMSAGSLGITLSPIPEEQEEEETNRIQRHRSRLGRRHQDRELSLVSQGETMRELLVPLVRLSLPSGGRTSWVLQEREEQSESSSEEQGSAPFRGWPVEGESSQARDFKPKTETIPFEGSDAGEPMTANMIGNTATLQIPAGTSLHFITKRRKKSSSQSRRDGNDSGEPVPGASSEDQPGEGTSREDASAEVRKTRTPTFPSEDGIEEMNDTTAELSSEPGSAESGRLLRRQPSGGSGKMKTPNTVERGSAKSGRSLGSSASGGSSKRYRKTPEGGVRNVQTRSSSRLNPVVRY